MKTYLKNHKKIKILLGSILSLTFFTISLYGVYFLYLFIFQNIKYDLDKIEADDFSNMTSRTCSNGDVVFFNKPGVMDGGSFVFNKEGYRLSGYSWPNNNFTSFRGEVRRILGQKIGC